MKRKFKQWWSTIPPIPIKRTISSQIIECKKYDVGNPSPVLGQAQKCGRVQQFNEIPMKLNYGNLESTLFQKTEKFDIDYSR